MGSYSYILVLAFILTSGVVVVGLQRDTKDADSTVGRYQAKIQARDIAQSGLSLVLRKLGSQSTPWLDVDSYGFPETEYQTGTFEAIVDSGGFSGGDTLDVTVVGKVGYIDERGRGGDTTHTIQAMVIRGLVAAIPPGFRNAITTDNYLLLQGSMEVRSMWKNINANVHTNGQLRARGNNFIVEGYGTYTTSTTVMQEDNFVPNVDWNGSASNVYQKDSVDIEDIDLVNLRAHATLYETGDYVIDGDGFAYTSFYDWADALGAPVDPELGHVGTITNPFILVADGHLTIQNQWDMEGYAMVVTASDMTLEPTGTGGGVQGRVEGYNTTLGLYAVGNIDVEGNATMTASMYSHARVSFHGTPILTGGIVARECQFIGGGNPIVTYVGPSTAIVKPGFTFREARGPVIIASAEW